MEKSSFFNSVNGDRKYKAEDWANYFKRLVTNGIFPVPSTNLQVMANSDMTITVKAGAAWINGYTYENTSELILPVDAADGVLSRIDRVVLKYDTVGREIKAIVKKGSFASSPVAPVLQRDADAYELGLADISIVAGAASIEQVSITDIRLNTELCGVVNSLIQADTTTLLNQYESGMQAKMIEFQEDFETWFASIEDVLDENTAGNLLNLINANSAALTDHEEAADPHDQYVLDSELAVLQDDITSHKAETANNAHLAKNIGVEDTAGNFESDDLEGAMAELFTNVGDGKDLVGTAITDVDSSVEVPTDPTFAELVTAIGQISTGKKWATGKAPTNTSGVILVENLAFKPSVIVIQHGFNRKVYILAHATPNSTVYSGTAAVDKGVWSVTATSFSTLFLSSAVPDAYWIAFE